MNGMNHSFTFFEWVSKAKGNRMMKTVSKESEVE